MKGPNFIHCIMGEINAILAQMKLNTRYTSVQRFYKEIPIVVRVASHCIYRVVGNAAHEDLQVPSRANERSYRLGRSGSHGVLRSLPRFGEKPRDSVPFVSSV